jgi:soluble lytic murein transglycosylase
LLALTSCSGLASADRATQREQFKQAWNAASRGDHTTFRTLGQGLEDYVLYPYHRYENYRSRHARVDPDEMDSFLEEHEDWGFAAGLKSAWLKSLGSRKRWQDLVDHAGDQQGTEVRCYLAQANIQLGNEAGLVQEIQSLWTVGKSQPDSCDPAFAWLRDNNGITPALAWERIRLAILAGNPRFVSYLARFVPASERAWVERWRNLDRTRYRHLKQADSWPDQPITRMLSSVSLLRLAQQDADRAMNVFRHLDGHFGWSSDERGGILREIALRGAVSLTDDAISHMSAVPADNRDAQLLEWWARLAMVDRDWAALRLVIDQMPPESKSDGRWRYWQAVANEQVGDLDAAREIRETLSLEATYYGFLAADKLGRPYTICPLTPSVTAPDIENLRQRPDFERSLELRTAGIGNWALSEWSLATGRLDPEGLRAAAALAWEEGWYDRVIFALGDSGDRRYYEWRFPVLWESVVEAEAARQQLDPAWVHGVIRSESALAETAISPAGALGLMQVMPATARRLARQHGLRYTGSTQLKVADQNIRFGTTFMRELLDRFGQNPVLTAGAYNAGPAAVDRWLDSRRGTDPEVWIESIPYFETRDYIPRVLAFTAIYDWRMGKEVKRISSRMPGFDSGNMVNTETAEVVCLASG